MYGETFYGRHTAQHQLQCDESDEVHFVVLDEANDSAIAYISTRSSDIRYYNIDHDKNKRRTKNANNGDQRCSEVTSWYQFGMTPEYKKTFEMNKNSMKTLRPTKADDRLHQ